MKLVFDVLDVDPTLGRMPPAEREVFPEPVISSRDGVDPSVWPGPVVSLEGFAVRHGWAVMRQYSRGCLSHGTTGRPLAERDYFALRMVSGDKQRRAWLVHNGTVWKSMGIWAGDVLPLVGELGVTAIKAWIEGPADPVAFRAALAVSVREAEVRKREAAARSAKNRASRGADHVL